MTRRTISFNTATPLVDGQYLQVIDADTGLVESAEVAGGGSALVRGSGLLQGHTDAGSDASAPTDVVFTITGLDTEFTWSLTVDSTPHLVTASAVDPEDGSTWMDSTAWAAAADIVAAMISLINGQAWGATAVDDAGTMRVSNSNVGWSANLSGAYSSSDVITVEGGGSGSDAVPPSGSIEEVEIIAQDGSKTVKPVKVGISGGGIDVGVELALKVGGAYYPIGVDFSSGTTTGEVAIGALFAEWIAGRASAALIARMTGTVPAGGELTCWAVAEQA